MYFICAFLLRSECSKFHISLSKKEKEILQIWIYNCLLEKKKIGATAHDIVSIFKKENRKNQLWSMVLRPPTDPNFKIESSNLYKCINCITYISLRI